MSFLTEVWKFIWGESDPSTENTSQAEKPKAEKPKAEKPKAEKPKVEKPKVEKPKAEKPKAEKPSPFTDEEQHILKSPWALARVKELVEEGGYKRKDPFHSFSIDSYGDMEYYMGQHGCCDLRDDEGLPIIIMSPSTVTNDRAKSLIRTVIYEGQNKTEAELYRPVLQSVSSVDPEFINNPMLNDIYMKIQEHNENPLIDRRLHIDVETKDQLIELYQFALFIDGNDYAQEGLEGLQPTSEYHARVLRSKVLKHCVETVLRKHNIDPETFEKREGKQRPNLQLVPPPER